MAASPHPAEFVAELDVDRHEWRCLELAWQACAAGTVGVGAVLNRLHDVVASHQLVDLAHDGASLDEVVRGLKGFWP